jgi:hypothetical protein
MCLAQPPYADVGRARAGDVSAERHPVIITARFRSGSTLLWNLFRHINQCTAFYEPFNERRWFDATRRGTWADATHRGVDDYWREYEGLTELAQFYNEDWTRDSLYMDESSWNPDMAAYVRLLVERAPQRPVLQFNRIDFRLPWFRRMFPSAHFVHLYRHPRDQWCSSLVDSSCSRSCTIADFRDRDGFYLLTWAADLKYRFPFLEQPQTAHPYRLFYFIWKLSYLFGVTYADHSFSFESLVENPEIELRRLFTAIAMDGVNVAPLITLVEPTPARWPHYASDEWFRSHESACEGVLADFFGTPVSQADPITAARSRELESVG